MEMQACIYIQLLYPNACMHHTAASEYYGHPQSYQRGIFFTDHGTVIWENSKPSSTNVKYFVF